MSIAGLRYPNNATCFSETGKILPRMSPDVVEWDDDSYTHGDPDSGTQRTETLRGGLSKSSHKCRTDRG